MADTNDDFVADSEQKLNDTPAHTYATMNYSTTRGPLNFARQAVLDDIGPIPIDDLESFMRDKMPKDLNNLTEKNIVDIKERLVKANILKVEEWEDSDGDIVQVESWVQYECAPSKMSGEESQVFHNFITIYGAISTAARDICTDRDINAGPPAITELVKTGSKTLLTEASNTSRCDAALIVDDDTSDFTHVSPESKPPAIEVPRSAGDPVDASNTPARESRASDIAAEGQGTGNASNLQTEGVTKDSDDANIQSATEALGSLRVEDETGVKRRSVRNAMAKANSLNANPDTNNLTRRDLSKIRGKGKKGAAPKKPEPLDVNESWHKVAVPWEYKKTAGPEVRRDNMIKSVWGGNHALRNDPCRRFAYGGTVEDTQMRLWKYTRAGVVVTEPVNWLEDITTVIKIFAIFAMASKTELGWDPSVKRVIVDKKIQYMYTIGGVDYITHNAPLCDYRADVFLGRGTRIYDVYEKGTDPNLPENHYALKDLWMREDAEEEGQFLHDLRDKMEEGEKKYFLTPLKWEKVKVYSARKKEVTVDSTRLSLPTPPKTGKFYLLGYLGPQSKQTTSAGTTHAYSRGVVPDIDANKVNALRIVSMDQSPPTHREHCRTLFREVCTTLHEVYNLETYFRGLLDATFALKILHRLGFAHRDVSTGNVLWDPSPKGQVAKLTDLEYRKGLSDTFAHEDYRTGTFQFMPIDVHGQKIRADGTDQSPDSDSDSDSSESEDDEDLEDVNSEIEDYEDRHNPNPSDLHAQLGSGSSIQTNPQIADLLAKPDEIIKPTAVFRYTILHDFESVFWMGLWGLLHHQPTPSDDEKEKEKKKRNVNKRLIAQLRMAVKVFPSAPRDLPVDRVDILMKGNILKSVLSTLPPAFKGAARVIRKIRSLLCQTYLTYYKNAKANPDTVLLPSDKSMIRFYRKFRGYIRRVARDKGRTFNFNLSYLSDTLLDAFSKISLQPEDETDVEGVELLTAKIPETSQSPLTDSAPKPTGRGRGSVPKQGTGRSSVGNRGSRGRTTGNNSHQVGGSGTTDVANETTRGRPGSRGRRGSRGPSERRGNSRARSSGKRGAPGTNIPGHGPQVG